MNVNKEKEKEIKLKTKEKVERPYYFVDSLHNNIYKTLLLCVDI